MGQLNLRLDDRVQKAFYQFCRRQQLSPYELLTAIVSFYGRAELITRGKDEEKLTNEEALVEMGRVVIDMQKFARANGEFLKAVAALLEPHGIKVSNLWPSWKETGEKTPA